VGKKKALGCRKIKFWCEKLLGFLGPMWNKSVKTKTRGEKKTRLSIHSKENKIK